MYFLFRIKSLTNSQILERGGGEAPQKTPYLVRIIKCLQNKHKRKNTLNWGKGEHNAIYGKAELMITDY